MNCPRCYSDMSIPRRRKNPKGYYWEIICIKPCGVRLISDTKTHLKNPILIL